MEMEEASHQVMNNELVPVEDEVQPLDTEEMQLDAIEPEPEPKPEEEDNNNNNNNNMDLTPGTVEAHPVRRRKKKSLVWEYFTIETFGDGSRRACCKQCKQSFAYSTGSKVAGTSHLKRHIDKGTCPVALRGLASVHSSSPMVALSDTPKRRYRTTSVPLIPFNADRCRQEITRMVIMNDYPLHIVEDAGFVGFFKSLQPRFDMVSFNTLQGDCVAAYLEEKKSIQTAIAAMPGRVCLALDLWSSSHTIGYVFVTAQFIDSDRKLQRKLLSVVMEPYPESDAAFSHSVAACLSEWGMVGKLFSVTVNQRLSEAAVDNLRALIPVDKSSVLDGQLLLGNCLARSMSAIAEDAFAFAHDVVKKVRDSVKYVKTSESREEKFLELKEQLQVPSSKSLSIDDLTRWNTTYEMLSAASELKEVFSCLDASDPDYKDAPSPEDWNHIQAICSALKPLHDTANLLTLGEILTTNTFFHETWKIKLELARAASSEDPFVGDLTKSMQEKYDQYWKSCCYVLAVAVVMDPRFKMKLVEFSFSKIYGDEFESYIKVVDKGIHELFHEYVGGPLALLPPTAAGGNKSEAEANGRTTGPKPEAGLADFDAFIMESTSQMEKSELDQYLEESLLPRVHEFDVIGWWKLNRTKYPTLSRMAHDVLTVPVCTVPAGSVFDTVRKEMDSYRCSLRPETVEALICARDWLMQSAESVQSQVVKMEVPI